MKQAIVNGATSILGSLLVHQLLQDDVQVLGINHNFCDELPVYNLSESHRYSFRALDVNNAENLLDTILSANLILDNCVFFDVSFFHYNNHLKQDVNQQLQCIVHSVAALKAAEAIGCRLFVHVINIDEDLSDKPNRQNYNKVHTYEDYNIYSLIQTGSNHVLKMLYFQSSCPIIFSTVYRMRCDNDFEISSLHHSLDSLQNVYLLSSSFENHDCAAINVSDAVLALSCIGIEGVPGCEYWIAERSADTK